jgi:hypothetical protein
VSETNARAVALSPDEMAAVVVTVTLLATARRTSVDDADVTPAWRFSGRHFGASARRR